MHIPDDEVEWRGLVRRQEGAVSRQQLLSRGFSQEDIRANVAAGRWQSPLRGVYVIFTGPLPPSTLYWIGLLCAGTGAMLSHATAGALWGLLTDQPVTPVHVTVPHSRGTRSRRGLVVHRPRETARPTGSPPRTDVSETVLALCAEAQRLSEVTTLLGRVAQQYPRALTEINDLVADRLNLRWRAEFLQIAQDVAGGAHSELERRYLVDVERAHRLPVPVRQRKVGHTRQDAYYKAYRTTVELDGRVVHRPVHVAWRDMTRDNAAAARAEITLRYGWDDVRHRPCAVAFEVAGVLRANGWEGRPKPCRPGCLVAKTA